MKRCARIGMAAAAVASMLTACGSPTPSPVGPTGGKLTVFAAASLKKAFSEIGEHFTTDNPGSVVEFSFAGSADLVTQLTQGAPADVLATADTKNMDRAATAGLLAGAPSNFATNTLTIVVAPGNPKKIAAFRDLAAPGLSVVVCAPQVPCGSATTKVEQATGVTLNPVSEESQVTDVLSKVLTGQADAGVVYVTDAQSAGDKVKLNFILGEIIGKEGISVSREELAWRITNMAERYQMTTQKLLKELQKHSAIGGIEEEIALGKALDVVVSHARVNGEEPKPIQPSSHSPSHDEPEHVHGPGCGHDH